MARTMTQHPTARIFYTSYLLPIFRVHCTGSPLTHKLEWLWLNFTHSISVVLRPVFCVLCFQSFHCLSLCTTDDWPRVRIIAISSAFAMIHSVRVAIFILALAEYHTKNYSSPVSTRCLSGIPSSALKWNVWARIFDEDNGWTLRSVVCVCVFFLVHLISSPLLSVCCGYSQCIFIFNFTSKTEYTNNCITNLYTGFLYVKHKNHPIKIHTPVSWRCFFTFHFHCFVSSRVIFLLSLHPTSPGFAWCLHSHWLVLWIAMTFNRKNSNFLHFLNNVAWPRQIHSLRMKTTHTLALPSFSKCVYNVLPWLDLLRSTSVKFYRSTNIFAGKFRKINDLLAAFIPSIG